MSTRQAIMTEILNRVSAIKIANGYATDAGLKIFFGASPELGPDDPAAALAVLVREDVSSNGDYGEDVVTTLPIDIQILAPATGDQPWVTIEQGIADIKRAMETADRDFGGLLAQRLSRGRTKPLTRAAGSTTIGAAVTYTPVYLDQWGS